MNLILRIAHNFTMGTMLEVQLDFKSDSTNGILLSLVPTGLASRYPQFSIFLRDGKVFECFPPAFCAGLVDVYVYLLVLKIIARETVSGDEYYEAVADFSPNKGYVCDGEWHNIRANYEKGSITLRVDGKSPIFALAEPETPHGRVIVATGKAVSNGGHGHVVGNSAPLASSTVGTIYIGGMDGTKNELLKHSTPHNFKLNKLIIFFRCRWC